MSTSLTDGLVEYDARVRDLKLAKVRDLEHPRQLANTLGSRSTERALRRSIDEVEELLNLLGERGEERGVGLSLCDASERGEARELGGGLHLLAGVLLLVRHAAILLVAVVGERDHIAQKTRIFGQSFTGDDDFTTFEIERESHASATGSLLVAFEVTSDVLTRTGRKVRRRARSQEQGEKSEECAH